MEVGIGKIRKTQSGKSLVCKLRVNGASKNCFRVVGAGRAARRAARAALGYQLNTLKMPAADPQLCMS